ncbi:hypothetical protein F5Y19DRAFT_381106 [Xylariaceae sp. FL1651]|nr:hypothetical protein F5Y19DRAFT_381106 [Xylariaceae sp. FL1651]
MQATPAGGPLEDHLRNLILTNSDPRATPNIDSSNAATTMGNLPPEGIAQLGGKLQSTQPQPIAAHTTSRGGRKRLNQAQRRQMNTELSIPIDTRAPIHLYSKQYTRPQQHDNQHPRQHFQQDSALQSHTATHPSNFQDRSALKDNPTYGQRGLVQPSMSSSTQHPDWRNRQPHSFDGLSRGVNVISADAFPSRGGRNTSYPQPALYNPGGYRQTNFSSEQLVNQSTLLDKLCYQVITDAEIGPGEIAEKESFRAHVEAICRSVVTRHEYDVNGVRNFQPETVELKCFGSLASGFATKAADMDLGLLSPMSQQSPDLPESPIPRLIEEALLSAGFGARLLTKTRIPIIKLCEKPDEILRQKLLDAREKWEKGLEEEDRDLEENVPDDRDVLTDTIHTFDAALEQTHTALQTPQPSSGVNPVLMLQKEISLLHQSKTQSLASYYSNTKRLLRRLNGRDTTHSNWQDFAEADFILLDKVASAFIHGLHDANLRNRILAYPSFHIGDTAPVTNFRSLFGVYTMVEGEMLLLLWETRQLSASNPKTEQEYERVVQRWKDMQYSKGFGTNPVWFNKELQLAVEALRQIPSIQIMQLQQEQHEPPIQYHKRTDMIALALSGAPSFPGGEIQSQIIQHYIDGIRDENIRNNIRDFVDSTRTKTLKTVAKRHKSLYLAANYERAIEKGLYRTEDLPILERYISILRRNPIRSIQQPTDFEYLIPIKQDETGLLESIKQLPDPSTLSPNKPRDRYSDSLEFPKSGVGVQCDINFSAHLALQNTLLLRCYSYTDHRVRPLVLFVKHWAKARGINTPYRGTLSSYGYVLMMLHYLVNVVEPFVCPNLQQLAPPDPDLPPEALEGITTCQGHNVRFWRDEQAIRSLAQQRQLNQNQDSLGMLLRGFFEYYAQNNMMSTISKRGFDWGRDVLSLRTHGGLLSKAEKGWTGAKTVIQPQTGASPPAELDATTSQSPSLNNHNLSQAQAEKSLPQSSATQTPTESLGKPRDFKEVRHRFLFAIEDPFELEHNVARTVTHNGIVAIRDEFRRAWRLIKAAGKTGHVSEDLLEDVKVHKEQLERRQFLSLLDEIHGSEVFSGSTAV